MPTARRVPIQGPILSFSRPWSRRAGRHQAEDRQTAKTVRNSQQAEPEAVDLYYHAGGDAARVPMNKMSRDTPHPSGSQCTVDKQDALRCKEPSIPTREVGAPQVSNTPKETRMAIIAPIWRGGRVQQHVTMPGLVALAAPACTSPARESARGARRYYFRSFAVMRLRDAPAEWYVTIEQAPAFTMA